MRLPAALVRACVPLLQRTVHVHTSRTRLCVSLCYVCICTAAHTHTIWRTRVRASPARMRMRTRAVAQRPRSAFAVTASRLSAAVRACMPSAAVHMCKYARRRQAARARIQVCAPRRRRAPTHGALAASGVVAASPRLHAPRVRQMAPMECAPQRWPLPAAAPMPRLRRLAAGEASGAASGQQQRPGGACIRGLHALACCANMCCEAGQCVWHVPLGRKSLTASALVRVAGLERLPRLLVSHGAPPPPAPLCPYPLPVPPPLPAYAPRCLYAITSHYSPSRPMRGNQPVLPTPQVPSVRHTGRLAAALLHRRQELLHRPPTQAVCVGAYTDRLRRSVHRPPV
jgi:hypothetical protein